MVAREDAKSKCNYGSRPLIQITAFLLQVSRMVTAGVFASVAKERLTIYSIAPAIKTPLRSASGPTCECEAPLSIPDQDTPLLPLIDLPLGGSSLESFAWSPCGSKFGTLLPNGSVAVYEFPSCRELFTASPLGKGIKAFYFSPAGKFLVTADRFEPKNPTDNCGLWDCGQGKKIGAMKVKRLAQPDWPPFLWSRSEEVAVQVEAGGTADSHNLRILSPTAGRKAYPAPGLTYLEISGSKLLLFSGRKDVRNGPPPRLTVLSLTPTPEPILIHDFHTDPADSISCTWNFSSDAVLVSATVEVDETGKNYYGKSTLYLLTEDLRNTAIPWKCERIADTVGTPVHDARWVPNQKNLFVAVAGTMPAVIGCYSIEGGSVTLNFPMGRAPRNTVRFSPSGRYCAVGGFGNLPGEVDLWDMTHKLVLKTFRVECTVDCSWWGRTFLTATTAPRMRVDNGFKLFSYEGVKLEEVKVDQLWGIVWKPRVGGSSGVASSRSFCPACDPPSSPRALVAATPLPQKTEVRQAYRPPGAASSAFAAVVRGDLGVDHLTDQQRKELLAGRKPRPIGKVLDATLAVVPETALAVASSTEAVVPVPILPSAPQVSPPPPPASPPPPLPPNWYYKDPSGALQGPFPRKMMVAWNKAGYFTPDLLISSNGQDFCPLASAFVGEVFVSQSNI